MSEDVVDIIVETWRTLQEYIPEKDKDKAGEHWVRVLQDNGVENEVLNALADTDEIMEEHCTNAMEEPLYDEEEDLETEDNDNY
jgi:predicted hydrolase (HD superfamily)